MSVIDRICEERLVDPAPRSRHPRRVERLHAAGAAAVGAGSALDDPGQARRLVEAVRRTS
jgi:hypothetical protein